MVNEMFRVNKRAKGLTLKIYIILVRTQQQWALQVTPVGFYSQKRCSQKINKKREAALKNEAGRAEKHVFFTWPYLPGEISISKSIGLAL